MGSNSHHNASLSSKPNQEAWANMDHGPLVHSKGVKLAEPLHAKSNYIRGVKIIGFEVKL